MLNEAGLNVGLAGNVDVSLAEQVIADEHDYYVLEISSFQLDDTHEFRPWIAVLLNITPDHLDRYNYSLERVRPGQAAHRPQPGQQRQLYLQRRRREHHGATSRRRLRPVHQMPFSLHRRPDLQLGRLLQSRRRSCALDLLPGYYSTTEIISTAPLAAHRRAQPPERAGRRAGRPRGRRQHRPD
ncbi:MAG: Mur ligase family protein [Hymenobacter sp.]